MTKKKLLIGLAAVVAVVILIVLMSGGAKPMYALPDAEDVNARENNYQTYLDQHGYDGSLSGAVVEVDVFTYTASEDAAITPYQNGIDSITVNVEAVDTGDVGSISWPFTVAESGFYTKITPLSSGNLRLVHKRKRPAPQNVEPPMRVMLCSVPAR